MIREWNITIPALTGEEQRKAYVYVPDSAYADAQRRYPVLYMFDGQNLFSDSEATYGKSWGLLDWLTEHNTPLIVAAAECSRHAETDECGGRLSEYSPFDFSGRWGDIKGRGELTMDWLIRDFKPYIDEHCPTLPDREHTFIAGSSMGGLMTLYALCAHGDVFSRGAALSPSLGFAHPKVRADALRPREKTFRRSGRTADPRRRASGDPRRPRRGPQRGLLGAPDPLLHGRSVL